MKNHRSVIEYSQYHLLLVYYFIIVVFSNVKRGTNQQYFLVLQYTELKNLNVILDVTRYIKVKYSQYFRCIHYSTAIETNQHSVKVQIKCYYGNSNSFVTKF